MTRGLLLDSHILLWLESEQRIRPETQFEIAAAAASRRLYMSDISVWEIGVALHKKSFDRRPDLQGLSVEAWFLRTVKLYGIQRIRISSRIALEAAKVPAISGYGDPGDCFLIATAHVRKLSLVTCDEKLLELAARDPKYLSVLRC
jgi:PIN domain nuclease of toxin-antitoxin system